MEALGLLNEQVQARIVHYKAELETNAELDAVTAQVVSELRALKAALSSRPAAPGDPEAVEQQQISTLTALLSRVFSKSSQFTTQVLKPVGRCVAKLFFESELHERTKGNKDKIIHHPEQAVYYVLQRYRHRLRAELGSFEYEDAEARQGSLELLSRIERELQVGFLSRRSPELNRVMTIYASVLSDFIHEHLPPRTEQLARVTLRAAKTAWHEHSVGYKVASDAFADFRREWERLFMQQMVFFCGDELLARLTTEASFRDETIKFFTDPHVFSETCGALCECLYDFLCLEGFLDLPLDWRIQQKDSYGPV